MNKYTFNSIINEIDNKLKGIITYTDSHIKI